MPVFLSSLVLFHDINVNVMPKINNIITLLDNKVCITAILEKVKSIFTYNYDLKIVDVGLDGFEAPSSSPLPSFHQKRYERLVPKAKKKILLQKN